MLNRHMVEHALCLCIKKPFIGNTPRNMHKSVFISKEFAKNPNVVKRFNEYLHLGPSFSELPNFVHPQTKKHLNVQPFSSIESTISYNIDDPQWKTFCKKNLSVLQPMETRTVSENMGKMIQPYLNQMFSTPILMYDQIHQKCILLDMLQPITFSKFVYELTMKKVSTSGIYSVHIHYYNQKCDIGHVDIQMRNIHFYFPVKKILQTFTPHFYHNHW